ncbi:hypothetical protein PCASD_14229 [Puccinia coronata f. sp. avenae]|uniref:Uncharacterized protein n=1 Tax=Puccinia coronata f. sp. avenae TaxID=200324 RepID=A0A2N5TNZ1_9BASI|nr:hypothetical protein PCASD_14229 [Puccinia coronata f. sp. avenae]
MPSSRTRVRSAFTTTSMRPLGRFLSVPLMLTRSSVLAMLHLGSAHGALPLQKQFAIHLHYPFLSFKPTLRTCPLEKILPSLAPPAPSSLTVPFRKSSLHLISIGKASVISLPSRASLSPFSKHRVVTLAFQREGPHTDADLSFSYPIDRRPLTNYILLSPTAHLTQSSRYLLSDPPFASLHILILTQKSHLIRKIHNTKRPIKNIDPESNGGATACPRGDARHVHPGSEHLFPKIKSGRLQEPHVQSCTGFSRASSTRRTTPALTSRRSFPENGTLAGVEHMLRLALGCVSQSDWNGVSSQAGFPGQDHGPTGELLPPFVHIPR